MTYSPEDICNESLDLIGYAGPPIGDMHDGSHAANVALRAYAPMIRLLLRSAPWNFARKSAPMQLLQDRTGNTPGIGTNTPAPFIYEYLFPSDAVKIRFVPWSWPCTPNGQGTGAPIGNIATPNLPNFPIPTNPAFYPQAALSPFVVAYDDTLPNQIGDPNAPGVEAVDWADAEGEGPYSKRVILTNACAWEDGFGSGNWCCTAVYTALTLIPETWDSMFREAFVQLLAARFAVPVLTRQGIKHAEATQIAAGHSAFAKDKALEARAMDNNESLNFFDHVPDWVQARRGGGVRGALWGSLGAGNADGYGCCYSGYDCVSFPGLSSF